MRAYDFLSIGYASFRSQRLNIRYDDETADDKAAFGRSFCDAERGAEEARSTCLSALRALRTPLHNVRIESDRHLPIMGRLQPLKKYLKQQKYDSKYPTRPRLYFSGITRGNVMRAMWPGYFFGASDCRCHVRV